MHTRQRTRPCAAEGKECVQEIAYTVFTRIVAAATINFSLVPVRLLIEGGSYSRVALTISTCTKRQRNSRIALARVPFMRDYNERDSSEFSLASRSRDSAMLMHASKSRCFRHAHQCGYYSRAALILHQLRLLFEGGYYSGCGYYSSKYGIPIAI